MVLLCHPLLSLSCLLTSPLQPSKLVARLEAGGLGGEVDVLGVEGHDVALGIGHGRRADGDTADDGVLLTGSHCLVLVDRPHIYPSTLDEDVRFSAPMTAATRAKRATTEYCILTVCVGCRWTKWKTEQVCERIVDRRRARRVLE